MDLQTNVIQKHILNQFLYSESSSYSQLKPKDLEGSVFIYHLRRLIGLGLIEKTNNDYRLTQLGRHYTGLISKSTTKLTKQPKIVVMIYTKNELGEYLLFEWKRQPYTDQVSLPYGKLHFGDAPEQAAMTELKEKTGLSGKISFLKDIYYKVIDNEQILTHMLIHIFEAKSLEGKLTKSVSGRAFWSKLDDKLNYVPGFHEILRHIHSPINSLEQVTADVK